MEGLERREKVNDPNEQTKATQDRVPLAPVQAPRPASFSRVGDTERRLGKVLGKVSPIIEKYKEKNQSKWELEGQMAYAEGKTEEEILEGGNRYTMAGFMSMKARTAGNAYQSQALADIDAGDKQLSSEDYQKKLQEQYGALTEQVAGQDPYTRDLMATMATNMFPKLVAQQVVSNNAWREDETVQSYTTMLMSEAGSDAQPDTLLELMSNDSSGLPEDKHKDAVANAISLSLSRDNGSLVDAIGLSDRAKVETFESSTGLPKGLLNAVIHQESRGNRNAVGPYIKGQGTAKSEMQVMDATNSDPGYGVTPAQNNSLEERARVGRDYLTAMYNEYDGDTEAALIAYNAGPGNANKFLKAGRDYNALPKKSETQPYVKKIMGQLEDEGGLKNQQNGNTVALLKQGFTPAQITKMGNAYDAYASRKANSFNKERIMWERDTAKEVELNGNLPEALDKIGVMQAQRGYTDAWASKMTNKVLSSQNAFEKERSVSKTITAAISNDKLDLLSGKDQQKALDTMRAQIATEVTSKVTDPNDAAEMIQNEYFSKLADNPTVTDKVVRSNIIGGLTGDVLNSDGSVKKEALEAYKMYNQLDSMSPDTDLAANHANKDIEDLVMLAREYDDGSRSDYALAQAATVMKVAQDTKSNPAMKSPIDNDRLKQRLKNEVIDEIKPGFLRAYGYNTPFNKSEGTKASDLREADLEDAVASPVFSSFLEARAKAYMADYSHLPSDARESMAIQRTIQDAKRSEFVMGTMVWNKAGEPTLAERMNVSGIRNGAHAATTHYLNTFGEMLYGDKFNDFQMLTDQPNRESMGALEKVGADAASFLKPFGKDGWVKNVQASKQDSRIGSPSANVIVNPDTGAIMIRPFQNKERTILYPTPDIISAEFVGELYNMHRDGNTERVEELIEQRKQELRQLTDGDRLIKDN